MDKIIIDSINTYYNVISLPTHHPLFAVVNLKEAANPIPAKSMTMSCTRFS